ncbi:unnamed protein product [Heterobilharzia americana]|nr:unnamed protein product [Heterobilharzia americana]
MLAASVGIAIFELLIIVLLLFPWPAGNNNSNGWGRAARSKPQRKKTSHSQSSDGETHKKQGVSGGEDVIAQDVDPNANGWHRTNRFAWHTQSGHFPHYPHQRHPSGQMGDTEIVATATQVDGLLRPSNEVKRGGGHGDWSRGCAGWRQRSYSGSEQSDVRQNHSNHRGRGTGHLSSEFDTGGSGRGRSRGRGSGRQIPQTHRESPNQAQNSKINIHRPISCLADIDVTLSAQTKNTRIYSRSFCIDPPPGFDIPVHEASVTARQSSTIASHTEEHCTTDVNNSANKSVCIQSSSLYNDDDGDDVTTSHCLEALTKNQSTHSRSWYYVDLSKHVQGPFSDQQMAAWFATGCLSLGVKIRRDYDECFLTLADHMNLAGRVPFWIGYNQPPITHANLLSTLNSCNMLNNNQLVSLPQIEGNQLVSSTSKATYPTPVIDEEQTQDGTMDDTVASIVETQRQSVHQPSSSDDLLIPESFKSMKSQNHHYHHHPLGYKKIDTPCIHQKENNEIISLNTIEYSNDFQSSLNNDQLHNESTNDNNNNNNNNNDKLQCTQQQSSLIIDVTSNSILEGEMKQKELIEKNNSTNFTDESGNIKKNKRRNKKANKKLTTEQERQLAWEAEFNRRKAAALEKKLTQEAMLRRQAEEEALAIAAEKALILQEQAHVLSEQRKREALRLKADKELSSLKLPQSARWAGGCMNVHDKSAVDLRSIQAAQAAEEAVVIPIGKTGQKSNPHLSNTQLSQSNSLDTNIPVISSSTGVYLLTMNTSDKSSSTISARKPSSATVTSIWDLPVCDKLDSTNVMTTKKANPKKKKKNREVASFNAKEELAHWCESQLSSMPLSGVDLPTLVDLLCELQASDEIVEFLESSLEIFYKSERIFTILSLNNKTTRVVCIIIVIIPVLHLLAHSSSTAMYLPVLVVLS